MKSSDHRRTGARIGRLPNRQGWFIIWYETRENKKVYHVIADPSHTLAFDPAPRRGLRVLTTPPPDNPFSSFIAKDDIILNVGSFKVSTPEEFTAALAAHKGENIGVLINKGGKIGGMQRSEKAGDTRDVADRNLTRWLLNRDRKTAGLDPIPSKLKFPEIVDMYLKWAATPASGYSPHWIRQVENIMSRHRERWKGLNVDEITPARVAQWFDEFGGKVAASTAANAVKPLRKCFAMAIERGYLTANPTAQITVKQPRQTTPQYLSKEQIGILIECAKILDAHRLVPVVGPRSGAALMPKHLADARRFYNADGTFDTARIRFFLLTGLRKSQLTSLTWKHYDPARGTLTLQSSKEHTEKSKRVTIVPLPDEARRILEGQPQNSNYIFPNLTGARDAGIDLRFARIAKLFEARGGGHVHLHILRHTALTYLLAATGDIAAVQAYAGHSDVRMTQRYAHILPSKLAAMTKNFSIAMPDTPADIPAVAHDAQLGGAGPSS